MWQIETGVLVVGRYLPENYLPTTPDPMVQLFPDYPGDMNYPPTTPNKRVVVGVCALWSVAESSQNRRKGARSEERESDGREKTLCNCLRMMI